MQLAAAPPFEYPSRAGEAGRVERFASLAAAAVLLGYGVSRRSVPGIFLAAASTSFAYRGLAGEWPGVANGRVRNEDTRAALAGDRGIHVREGIRLEKPLSEVYRFWRRLENLPRFMLYLEEVRQVDERRSHWVARGPAGRRVEWDAEIINEVENDVIAWRSLPGSDVITAGSVRFSPARRGRLTQVAVHFQYAAPGGRAAALLATALGRAPSQEVREDLRRVKQLLEAGEIPRGAPERRARRRR